MWSILLSVVPVLIAALGLYLAFRTWQASEETRKTEELRREEVLAWSNDCIECRQSIAILSKHGDAEIFQHNLLERRAVLVLKSSALIEQGRLCFKNDQSDESSLGEIEPYSGWRPKILDQLMMAHQIVLMWPEPRTSRASLARICVQNFVTLAQEEVGRSRSASKYAAEGGDSVNIKTTINRPDSFRLN